MFDSALVMVAVLAAGSFAVCALAPLDPQALSARVRATVAASAAGILLAVAIADLIPEAIELGVVPAVWGMVIGLGCVYALEHLAAAHAHHHEHDHDPAKVHVAPFIAGLGLHNLIDGVTIATGAHVSTRTVATVGFGMLFHQVPVGLSVAALLAVGKAPRSQVLATGVGLGAAILVGAFGLPPLLDASGMSLAALLGFAGGALLYIGGGHLLPEAHRDVVSPLSLAAFLVTFFGFTYVAVAGSH